MRLSSDLRPVTDLKRHAADLLEEVNRDQRPLVITQNGQARAVLMDIESYERLRDQLGVLQLINQSRAELAAGKGIPQEKVFDGLRRRIRKRHAT